MKFPIFGGSDDDFGTADTYAFPSSVHGINWSTTETLRQIPISEDVIISNFKVMLTTAPGSGKTRTFTIRKNGVNTAVTCTISNTDTSGTFTGAVAFSAGDLLSIKASSTGTPDAPGATYWHMYMNTIGNKALLMGCNTTAVSNSATNYGNMFPSVGWGTTDTLGFIVIPTDGNLTKLAVSLSAAPGSGKSYALSVRLNNSSDALTTTISDANTSGSVTGSQAIAAGNTVNFKSVPSSTPTAAAVAWCFTFEPSTPGETFSGFGHAAAVSTVSLVYEQPLGSGLSAWSTSSSGRRIRLPACSIKNFRGRLSVAPGVGTSRTISLNYDSETIHNFTISETDTSGVDTDLVAVPEDSGSAGLIISASPSALPPAASSLRVSYVIVTPQPPEAAYGYTV